MTAIVKIVDDNGNPKGVYELAPSRIYEGGISTKYVLNDKYTEEVRKNDGSGIPKPEL